MVCHTHGKFINFWLTNFCYSKVKEIKLFTGHLFSNSVKIMLAISDTQYYVPIKLCRMV